MNNQLLLVSAQPKLYFLHQKLLGEHGVKMNIVASAVEAVDFLDRAQKLKFKVGLVLVDLQQGPFHGLELAAELVSQVDWPSLKMIAVGHLSLDVTGFKQTDFQNYGFEKYIDFADLTPPRLLEEATRNGISVLV